MSELRVRFAPSPTGYLHIGGARTALFNWLWVKKHGGKLILRIEDTDRERSTSESIDAIFDSLRWLGLDWDEGPDVGGPSGPYFQMQRLATYRERAEEMVRRGGAYRCYCTKEELAEARAQHTAGASRQAFKYPGTCRSRSDQPDLPHVIRLRAPQSGVVGWLDLVKGRIDVPNESQQDVVLMRTDGVPLYNFGAAIDDATMEVTLIARGDDHVVNTPIQILIWQALGYPIPQLAHLPMILAPNGEKLSKRHAAVSVLDYKDQGYLPDAVLNYLARLGWSHGDQEIFTREELIEYFSWDHVGSTGARYDGKKFSHVQSSHLRQKSDADIARLAAPFVHAKGIVADPEDPRLAAAVATVKTRATTLADVANMIDFYFMDELTFDEQAKSKFLRAERAEQLRGLHDVVREVEPFTHDALEQRVGQWLAERGLALKEVAQPARVALTGRAQSPGLYEVLEVLGRERSLDRLSRGAAIAQDNAG